jgi:hypothetical protein
MSALRLVRDRLEHSGYSQQVTAEAERELQQDIGKFERELFPDNFKQTENPQTDKK